MVVEDEDGGGATVAPPPGAASSNNLQILEARVENLPRGVTIQDNPEEGDGETEENKEHETITAINATTEMDTSDTVTGSFDCNICLELAQDPVVTLCGHLFCWPCLYKWMQLRPAHKECPVCKASIQEERVIPLYGRGLAETPSDSASRSSSSGGGHGNAGDASMVHDLEIPSRPPGQRSDNSLAWHARRLYDPYGIGFIAGAAGPTASARFGNVTFSAGFGLFPSLFRLQFHHGFPDSASSMLPYGATFSANHHLRPMAPVRPDQQDTLLSRLLLFVGGVMILCFLYF